ncbi:hypothetical protein EPUS_00306 [Endocarpon pusillum Z07020]|uniref:Nudix hydrolase domain-containing protein n=1 Tax=Endocarpon pusillum (strain Z07020 / HMAS-L-300199) TaxID=1263415 RepID=U1HMA2_ENDPU|nr:uncharacterized protein EPUS_00306 [Endocarpon pusillum Z07020]ERF70119.1 hypothetical protein EPUS_00306 [Endocarpon pusillum Z07020]
MAPNPKDAKVTSVEPMPPDEARWIRLNKITYTDPIGRSRSWESAERQTRPTTSQTDGVGVVAILHHPTGPALLLQKQFRPPLNTVTVEVPSGLIDPNETPSQCALRELKEETGYIATIPEPTPPADNNNTAESFVMHNDPGFCNTNTQMVTVQVDMADPRNRAENLMPELEENEFIECFSLPLESLWEDLRRLEREEGVAIDARVGTLAMGMEIAKRFGLGRESKGDEEVRN